MRVIELVPDQLLTGSSTEQPRMSGGQATADPGRDLAKIAVVERHHATGRIGRGFVRGFVPATFSASCRFRSPG